MAGPLLVPAAGAVGEGAEVVGGGVCVLSGACEALATAAVVVGTAVAVGVGVGEVIQHRKEITDAIANAAQFSRRSYGNFADSLPHLKSKAGRPRWADPDRSNRGGFYEYDPSHGGELERYNRRGEHIGVYDPQSGAQIKDEVKGRTSPP